MGKKKKLAQGWAIIARKRKAIWQNILQANYKQLAKVEARSLLFDILGSAIYAIGIVSFASKADFAPGGVTGMALILHYLFKLPIGSVSLWANIPLLFISYKYLKLGYTFRTLQTLIINAIFLDYIAPLVPYYTGNPLLAAVFAGACSGMGLFVIYNAGSCTGGTDIIIMSARKVKPHLSIGQITMVTDGSIILAGAFIYKNVDAVLYGILFTVVSTIIIDKFMYGTVSGKMSLIISSQSHAISEAIGGKIRRGSTFLQGKGSYSGEKQEVLMCACSKRQLPEVRQIVREVDSSALMIVLEYSEVRGHGFLSHF